MCNSESSLKCRSNIPEISMTQKHAAAYRPIPRAHECHHRHSSPTANLGQKTIAIVFCSNGQPGAENYRHSFLLQVGRGTSSIRSHLGKSSRKYRWPRRKCLEEIYKRSKGKQKVIRPRSNVLQQLFWTIYLTWLSWDELVITLRSRSFEIIHIFFQLQQYSLWTWYPRGTLVFSLQLFFSVLCLCHNQLQRKISVD